MGWFDNIMVHQIRPCKIDWNSQGVIKLSFDFIDMKHIFFLNFLDMKHYGIYIWLDNYPIPILVKKTRCLQNFPLNFVL